MPETYRIDEGMRRVYVTHDGKEHSWAFVPFDKMEQIARSGFRVRPERRDCYLIARDELLERGLIREAT